MSILKYCVRLPDSSKMPNPSGPLSREVPSLAIVAANKEVRQLTSKSLRGSYHKYTSKERADIGRYALSNGVQAAKLKFSREMKVKINESTVRLFKNQYKLELEAKRAGAEFESDTTISVLNVKKRGRKLLLGDKTDLMVQKYIADIRRVGGAVSTAIVRAGARGILLSQDRTRLAEFGGPATLSKAWATSLLKRMNFTKRRSTTKYSVPPENFLQEKNKFLQQIVDIVKMEDIPMELIFNWDQTGLNLVPASPWTMARKGSKRIEMKGLTDKRQNHSCILWNDHRRISSSPTNIWRENRPLSCYYSFPCDWNITHSDNHWSNESTMLMYIEEIIIPYVDRAREYLNVDESQAALAIFDHFKGQLTENVVQLLEEHNIQSVLVPASCTDRLQPLDISVNKSAKSFLKSEFQKWYSEEIAHQLSNSDGDIDNLDPVDLTTARMKCVSARWIEQMFNYLSNSPDIIVHGFKAIASSIEAGKPVLADIDSDNETDDCDSESDLSAEFSSDE